MMRDDTSTGTGIPAELSAILIHSEHMSAPLRTMSYHPLPRAHSPFCLWHILLPLILPPAASSTTCAHWPGIVPHRLPIGPQDAAQGREALNFIAPMAVVGDGGAQLQVGPHSCAIFDRTRIET